MLIRLHQVSVNPCVFILMIILCSKEQYDRKLERMLRNDDSDMEDYDSDEECDFGFDVDDFFFHIFGFVISNVKFIEIC